MKIWGKIRVFFGHLIGLNFEIRYCRKNTKRTNEYPDKIQNIKEIDNSKTEIKLINKLPTKYLI